MDQSRSPDFKDEKTELPRDEKEYVESVQTAEKEFHTWLGSKRNIPNQVKVGSEKRSFDDAAAGWFDASQRSKSGFNRQHQIGWRSWARSAESFAAGASQFMTDFKPLVEVVAACGPYGIGSLAAGTLSAMFAIAKARCKAEDAIITALAGVMDRLRGFRFLKEIYSSDRALEQRVRQKIIVAYSGIIELSIAAARFYLRSGIGRWWESFHNPENFVTLAAKVQSFNAGVQDQCDLLLVSRVHEMRDQNEKLLRETEKLRSNNDRNMFMSLQASLGLSNWSLEEGMKTLNTRASELERDKVENHYLQWMDQAALVRYRDGETFQRWINQLSSTMLLIIVTLQQGSAATLSFCLVEIGRERVPTFRIAICEILLQVLKVHEHTLSDSNVYEGLHTKLERYRSQRETVLKPGTDDAEAVTVALKEATTAIFGLFEPDRRVYIILDRIDRIAARSQLLLLEFLVELMEKSSCCVKVLAVASETYWDVDIADEPDLKSHPKLEYHVHRQATVNEAH